MNVKYVRKNLPHLVISKYINANTMEKSLTNATNALTVAILHQPSQNTRGFTWNAGRGHLIVKYVAKFHGHRWLEKTH